MLEILQRISINPEIRFGKPCIAGTRITIGDVLSFLGAGMSEEEIKEDYPELTTEDIRAALIFAANREVSIQMISATAA